MMFAPITMLGCMATATGCFTRDSFEKSLYEILPERKHNLIPINMEAFDRGAAFAK
jgi:2-oxoglutarate ferredoxin oxidoreductase subunit gamma